MGEEVDKSFLFMQQIQERKKWTPSWAQKEEGKKLVDQKLWGVQIPQFLGARLWPRSAVQGGDTAGWQHWGRGLEQPAGEGLWRGNTQVGWHSALYPFLEAGEKKERRLNSSTASVQAWVTDTRCCSVAHSEVPKLVLRPVGAKQLPCKLPWAVRLLAQLHKTNPMERSEKMPTPLQIVYNRRKREDNW